MFKKLMIVLFAVGMVGCGKQVKHTQVVTCVGSSTIPGFKYTVFYMERPNKEVFTMMFDNPAAIPPNAKLKDVVYTDVDANTVHFIKAQIQ